MLRVRTIFSGVSGTPWYSNLYFINEGLDAQACVEATGGFWSLVDNHITSLVTWATEPDVSQISIQGVLEGTWPTTPRTGTGGGAGDRMPHQIQGLLRCRTGVFTGGREIRGRVFLPGMVEGDSNNGVPTSTWNTDILAAANQLRNEVVAQWSVWSRRYGSAASITSVSVAPFWASLRSRRD